VLLARAHSRAAAFPKGAVLWVLIGCFAAWGFDGVNSYALLLRREVLLYTPQNWLRLLTGAGMGATLGVCATALFNQVVWRVAHDVPVIERVTGLGPVALCALAVIGAALWRPAFLYGPLATLSGLGVIGLLTLVNSLLAMLITKRYGTFETWRAQLPFFALGLALAVGELAAIAALRLIFLPDLSVLALP
jgi:hypothetical protein